MGAVGTGLLRDYRTGVNLSCHIWKNISVYSLSAFYLIISASDSLDYDHHHLPPLFFMDTFAEPYTRQGDDVSIDKVHEQIVNLEEEHRKNGIPLSGRIIHVCHYLPITAALIRPGNGVPSPPATPPSEPTDVLSTETDKYPQADSQTTEKQVAVWSLSPRYGHAAMISGIRSLSQSHEQVIVGWTGDIHSESGTEKVPVDTITQQERDEFEASLKEYHPKESDPDDEKDRKTNYIAVWLEDKVAHGHYDGYCKQSMLFSLFNIFS